MRPAVIHVSPPDHIGLIGLGLMGRALAERLCAAGFEVIGYDLSVECGAALASSGAQIAGSAREVAERARGVLFSLPDDAAVAVVLTEIAPVLGAEHLIIDTTTGAPAEAERRAAALAGRGVAYLDAPVSGSSEQTRSGEGVVLVGGEAEVFACCAEVWRALGGRAVHTGPSGSGARMKLVTNLVLGLNRAALAEGLVFARTLGLDAQQSLDVLTASAAYSRIMDAKGPKMLSGDFTPQARLSQHLKDVRLMLASGAHLPLTEAHRALLERAETLGCGPLDNSSIIRACQT